MANINSIRTFTENLFSPTIYDLFPGCFLQITSLSMYCLLFPQQCLAFFFAMFLKFSSDSFLPLSWQCSLVSLSVLYLPMLLWQSLRCYQSDHNHDGHHKNNSLFQLMSENSTGILIDIYQASWIGELIIVICVLIPTTIELLKQVFLTSWVQIFWFW